jgi:hypothetical protein
MLTRLPYIIVLLIGLPIGLAPAQGIVQGAQIPAPFVGHWGSICTEEEALKVRASNTNRTDVPADCDTWLDPDKWCAGIKDVKDQALCRSHTKEEYFSINRHVGIGDIKLDIEYKAGEVMDNFVSFTPQADGSWYVIGVLGGINNECWRDLQCRNSREGRDITIKAIWRLEQRGRRTLLIRSILPSEFRDATTNVWCKMALLTEPLHQILTTPNDLAKNWHPKCLGD